MPDYVALQTETEEMGGPRRSVDTSESRSTLHALRRQAHRARDHVSNTWKVWKSQPNSSELVAIALVYLVQGVTDLAALAQKYLLKDELHASPAQVTFVISAGNVPWAIKPAIGLISDTLPLWGYRRKSYLIAAGLAGAVGWLLLALPAAWGGAGSMAGVLGLIVAVSGASAVSDVVVDSMVVERARREAQVGSAWFSGSLVERLGPRPVFALTALLPLLVVLVGVGRFDADVELQLGEVAGPVLFLFLSSATPAADDAMFFFMTAPAPTGLGFSATFLGVGVYHAFLRRLPLRRVLLWGSLLAAACQASSLVLATRANVALGLPDHLFALGDSVLVSVIQNVLFMPTMVLSARLCPPGLEATLFAGLMSVGNIATGLRYLGGALLTQLLGVTATDFRNLPLLLVLCSIALVLPLPLLLLVPASLDQDREEQGREQGGGGAAGGADSGGGGGLARMTPDSTQPEGFEDADKSTGEES
eukprot:XP_001699010.1 folate transporter [Chlamydomonas reinhardtii]